VPSKRCTPGELDRLNRGLLRSISLSSPNTTARAALSSSRSISNSPKVVLALSVWLLLVLSPSENGFHELPMRRVIT
jgi:hypothetical protein